MRTTFTVADDAARLAQSCAAARSLRLGQAVSELICRASLPPVAMRRRGQAWVFELPADAPRVTASQVKALLDETPCARQRRRAPARRQRAHRPGLAGA